MHSPGQSAHETPAVSIIVCTRNRGPRISRCIEAIAAIRSRHAWEAIFVDNASTDDTAAIIRDVVREDRRLSYLSVERIGLGAARDAAWRAARGALVLFTDDDCYVDAGIVDQLVAVFEEFPDIGGAGGKVRLYDQTDARVTIDERAEPVDYPARRFLRAGSFRGANLAFRRDALRLIGGFDPGLGAGTPFPAEDIDVCARIIWAGLPMRYDPRLIVDHHHGRKERDAVGLRASYDRGRGAYFAKFIARADTRRAYLGEWLRSRFDKPFGEAARELEYALRYLARHRLWTWFLGLALVSPPCMVAGGLLRRARKFRRTAR